MSSGRENQTHFLGDPEKRVDYEARGNDTNCAGTSIVVDIIDINFQKRVTKEKSSVQLIGRRSRKKKEKQIGGKKGKGVTGWLEPNHATMSTRGKKGDDEERNEREPCERAKRA